MLTRLRVRNFKKFEDVDIELGPAVVLIGPNNSGKTAALQALALWDIGRRRWTEKRGGRPPGRRPGVTINRNDIFAIPVPVAKLLWRDLHVQDVRRVGEARKQDTKPVFVDIVVDGITNGNTWSCGLEFYYANPESFYCRPLRLPAGKPQRRMVVPREAADVRVAFLPPMSGLAEREFGMQHGQIGVLIGQGQTAQVLRNLCYRVFARAKGIGLPDAEIVKPNGARAADVSRAAAARDGWEALVSGIKALFGVRLLDPVYIAERSEITMSYEESSGVELDLSSSGRGLQQTLLLLAHLYGNPNTVLLLDEPDAHLEVLRQRQTYKLLTDVALQQGSQIIAASHSEVVLNEAAGRDVVVAFVGNPHRIDDRVSQVLKSLKEIGFEQYYMAQDKGWVLYLEGPTDLSILRTLADTLDHPARVLLEQPFVHYVGNKAASARDHFFGLAEAHQDLVGVAVFDRSDFPLQEHALLKEYMWARREVENYICSEDILLEYARGATGHDLFSAADSEHRVQVMHECITEMTDALRKLKRPGPWSADIKASDEFLDPLFENYFEKLGLPNQMRKSNYHVLARFVPKGDVDPEVGEKLDAIAEVAGRAKPVVS